jgi:5-formyltetrahydrofolate cyclo-ligase
MKDNKTLVRKILLEKRGQIDPTQKMDLDKEILKNLTERLFYKEAENIFIYVSIETEVDTHRIIIKALEDGKKIYVPKIKSKSAGMEIFRIKSIEDLKEGYFGILEPSDESGKIEGDELDLIVVPGVAFDREGYRIGYGGGFYDKFFKNLTKKIPKIAIGYNLQIVDKIAREEHDEKINGLITESDMHIFL